MRVGLFFGSFDPPHIGHVNVVMGAINSNQVDRVLVIPAYQNLWKENSSKFSYRYAMSCMQFDTLPFVHVSDVEKDLAGPAYPRGIPTYVVLEELRSRMPEDELVIITTPETYKDIPEWHKGSVILCDYKFLMVVGGFETDRDRDSAMTNVSSEDIAFIRSKSKWDSGTAENILRRHTMKYLNPSFYGQQ